MLFMEQPTDPWTRGDFKLLEAYQTLQDETCGDCGRPVWLCHSEDSDLQWEVRKQVCYATKTLKDWQDAESKKKGKSHNDNGVQPVVVPYMLSFDEKNTPVKDFENLPGRTKFFEAQQEE